VPAETRPGPIEAGLESLIRQSRDDLSRRVGVDVGQIEVVEARTVTWPDRGLGCPQPGMIYPQVQVDGVLIRLRVGSRVYEYHAGGGREPFLCESPSTPPPGQSGPTGGAGPQ